MKSTSGELQTNEDARAEPRGKSDSGTHCSKENGILGEDGALGDGTVMCA